MTKLALGAVLPVCLALCSFGQTPPEPVAPAAQSPAEDTRPLPGIPKLMQEVETQEHKAETFERDYIYREAAVEESLDSSGKVKKTESREFDNFTLDGVAVRRLVRKNGQELTPEEQKKQSERIDKEVSAARERRRKAEASGKPTDANARDEITWSRMLELGSFTNARREAIDGRDAIAVDFTGNSKAKTHNQLEAAVHELAGTVWIDEADKAIVRLDAHFANPYRIGGGLLVNVRKGTEFHFETRKINGEVWLPASLEAHGQARVMLFFNFDGAIHVRYSGYRKFKATSTILPGLNEVDDGKLKPPAAKP
jgi:hypothetical protein